jgi:Domain of unknown function (DUF4902)
MPCQIHADCIERINPPVDRRVALDVDYTSYFWRRFRRSPETESCSKATSTSGYTEWVSAHKPTISIAWDWCIQFTLSGTLWTRVGLPRSNVMLIEDAGWERSRDILATFVDALPWREQLPQVVAARYT